MLSHPIFDLVMLFYGVSGGALLRYLWICRTPIDASVHRLQIPEFDEHVDELVLHSSSDVGVV